MTGGRFDRILGVSGLILGALGVVVWIVALVVGFDDYGRPGGLLAWSVFWLMVLSMVGAILLTVRHFTVFSGGAGSRWVGWGCGIAILTILLIAGPAAEPLYTDGDWDRFVTNDFPAAIPVKMAGLSFALCGFGLLRDYRAPSLKKPLRPLTGDT